MNYTFLIAMTVILGVIYFALMPMASNGYGYMGYYGFRSSPSVFYNRGGTGIFYGRDMRSGSVGGPSVRGGGPSSGK